MVVLYGIPNCDTVKKARKWLDAHDVLHTFHDFRKDGLTQDVLQEWLTQVGADLLINSRSATWRGLADEERALLQTGKGLGIIIDQPTLIKRPVLEKNGKIIAVGFKENIYTELMH